MRSIILFLSFLLFVVPQVVQADEWYASSRHGECISLASLNENRNLVKGAKTPSEMVEMLEQTGVEYTLKPLESDEDGMFRLDVPSMEWAMLLVKKEFCREFLER